MWRRAGARTAAAALITLSVGLVGAAPADVVAYPAPGPMPPVTAMSLTQRYAATAEAVQDALVVAQAEGDHQRAATLERFRDRQLLDFDGRGNGRAVEVIGDLVTADRIAVVVPGSHTTLDTFDRVRGPGGGARALAADIGDTRPDVRVAVVAWLGYDTPQGASADSVTDRLAEAGSVALRTTVAELHGVNQGAPISLLCHSYGSVVCAYAANEVPVADIAFYGSPGVVAGNVDELATSARVWAARAAGDWVRFVPSVRLAGLGFGADPVAPAFGARPFPAGDGGHGDYHLREGVALRSLVLITLGEMEGTDG